jgi:hypothetical protein
VSRRDRTPDAVRRALRDAESAQRAALPRWNEALRRVVEDDPLMRDTDPQAARAAVGIGWSRRAVLRAGGTSVAMASVLAACGIRNTGEAEEPGLPQTGGAPTTEGVGDWNVDDTVLLRTATSLEQAAVDVYQAAFDNGWVTTPALVAAAELFQQHHREHKEVFAAATRAAGVTVYESANPVVMDKVVGPAVEGIVAADDPEVATLAFAHALEGVAASTYQSIVPVFGQPRLRLAAMSVGGVEARHQAVLAGVLPNTLPIIGVEALRPTTTVAEDGEAIVPVYQVPGAFGSLEGAVGPASLIYPYTSEAGVSG